MVAAMGARPDNGERIGEIVKSKNRGGDVEWVNRKRLTHENT
jgi:hypothetical protein